MRILMIPKSANDEYLWVHDIEKRLKRVVLLE